MNRRTIATAPAAQLHTAAIMCAALFTSAAVIGLAVLSWGGDPTMPSPDPITTAAAIEAQSNKAPGAHIAPPRTNSAEYRARQHRTVIETVPPARPEPPGPIEVRVAPAHTTPDTITVTLTSTRPDLTSKVLGNCRPNDDGIVHLSRAWLPKDEDVSVCVDAGFPSAGSCIRQLDNDTESVQLALPELANLHVRVLEADGSPLRQHAVTELRVLTAAPPADRRHRYDMVDGDVRCGIECSALVLEVSAFTLDGRRTGKTTVIGPSTPGGAGHVELRLAPRPTFAARLLDANGTPLGRVPTSAYLQGTSIRLPADPTTNQHGIVRLRQYGSHASRPQLIRFLATASDGRRLNGAVLAGFSIGPGAVHDVWLAESPRLVAGVCVDEDGRPQANVPLRIQTVDKHAERVRLFGSRWRELAHDPIVTRADGTFDVSGPAPGGSVRIQVRSHPAVVQPFAVGAPGVRIVLDDHASETPQRQVALPLIGTPTHDDSR